MQLLPTGHLIFASNLNVGKHIARDFVRWLVFWHGICGMFAAVYCSAQMLRAAKNATDM